MPLLEQMRTGAGTRRGHWSGCGHWSGWVLMGMGACGMWLLERTVAADGADVATDAARMRRLEQKWVLKQMQPLEQM